MSPLSGGNISFCTQGIVPLAPNEINKISLLWQSLKLFPTSISHTCMHAIDPCILWQITHIRHTSWRKQAAYARWDFGWYISVVLMDTVASFLRGERCTKPKLFYGLLAKRQRDEPQNGVSWRNQSPFLHIVIALSTHSARRGNFFLSSYICFFLKILFN